MKDEGFRFIAGALTFVLTNENQTDCDEMLRFYDPKIVRGMRNFSKELFLHFTE